MWGAVVVAAISAYAAAGGKVTVAREQDDWMRYEERRQQRLADEARAVRRQALVGAALLVALAGTLVHLIIAGV